ncbi:uncharacterized protein LOC134283976 [Aedes albopictus]|uniref:Secreted protein n=1 Tax=Aedes albopictus TaxID=7160 RepID=A0ABM1Y6I9_AEDAL|nr:uncharacterized protein LOC109414780 [Aedes albopictus]
MSKMEKSSARSAMLVLMAVMVIALALPVESKDVFKDCSGVKNSMYCFGSMMVQNGLKRLASEKSLQIAPGLEVVETASQESADEGYRSFNEVKEEDTGVLARVSRYLANHELKINLSEMMRKNELQNVLKTIQDDMVGEMQEARKKDKGGMGAILMMGVMMSKMLGALGFGGVAMLAMKALGVSMMALLLSGILGLKKLTEGGGDHKGRHNQDVDFQVFSGDPSGNYESHQDGSGHRRISNLAYRGWSDEYQRV